MHELGKGMVGLMCSPLRNITGILMSITNNTYDTICYRYHVDTQTISPMIDKVDGLIRAFKNEKFKAD